MSEEPPVKLELVLAAVLGHFALFFTVIKTMNETRDRILFASAQGGLSDAHKALLYTSDWTTMRWGSVLGAVGLGVVMLLITKGAWPKLNAPSRVAALFAALVFLSSGIGHWVGTQQDRAALLKIVGPPTRP